MLTAQRGARGLEGGYVHNVAVDHARLRAGVHVPGARGLACEGARPPKGRF